MKEAEEFLADDEDLDADDINEKKKDLESICNPVIKKYDTAEEEVDYESILSDL